MKFQTKPQIALSRIEAALEAGVARGVVRALPYAVGVQPTLSVWPPGEEPLPARAWIDDGMGFQLVPWRPALERALGNQVTCTVFRGSPVEWSFGRARGIGV